EVVRWMADRPEVAFAQPATFHMNEPDRLESLGTLLSLSGHSTVLGRHRREARPGEGGAFVAEIFSVLGAAFVARRSVFEELGGFDESMFMYFEETDLCWRAGLRGYRSACWFDPARPTRVRHRFHGTHPRGFSVARYFERNRTLSMIRNLERRNLWHLVPNVLTVVGESAPEPMRFLRYAREVTGALPTTARRRRVIQAGRRR